MPIITYGLNHTTASIALREQLFFAQEKLPIYLQDLCNQPNIREAVILSTCNRTEIYCEADEKTCVLAWLQQQFPQCDNISNVLYCYEDQLAIAHMMQVACGLDSMVLGEPQILGQMKVAFSEGCAAGTVGTLFHRLFQQIFNVAKKIRTTTTIGACSVSVASSAVSLAKQVAKESFAEKTVLAIGAGETAELLLRYLATHCCKQIIIANRSLQRAEELANVYAATAVAFTELPRILKTVDIIFAATGSAQPVLTKTMLQDVVRALTIIDIAVPRNVAANVTELSNIQLYSIDDLQKIIQQNVQGREHAAEKAREMIENYSNEFMLWLHSLEKVSNTIRVYRKQIEDLCRVELAKAQKQLQRGDEPMQVLMMFSHSLTNKLLHTPSVQLRQAGFEGRFELLQWAQQLFAITPPEVEAV